MSDIKAISLGCAGGFTFQVVTPDNEKPFLSCHDGFKNTRLSDELLASMIHSYGTSTSTMSDSVRVPRIAWNADMEAAPKDGFYVLVRLPHIKNPRGVLACFHDGKWRTKPKSDPLPTPTHWRYRPENFL